MCIERRWLCYGVERDWSDFRFLSGRKWIARLRFHTSFTSAFYWLTTATYCSDVAKWWTRDRRDFYFPSRYFRFRPGGKPLAFRVNIRADSVTLDRFSRDCERRVIPVDLDWATTSGRAVSASGGSKGAAPGADTTIDLLVGATKPGFSM